MNEREAIEAFRQGEEADAPPARCGFCGRIVDGDTTAYALESEAYAAHPDSLVRGLKYDAQGRCEVFACEDGTGCMK